MMSHNKNITAQVTAKVRQRQTACKLFGAALLMSGSILSQTHAQVRTESSSGGISTGSTAVTGGSIGGIRTQVSATTSAKAPVTKATPKAQPTANTPSTAPQIGGVRVDAPVASTPQSGSKATAGNQGNGVTVAKPASAIVTTVKTNSVSTTTISKKAPYVPDRVPTDTLGNPLPTSVQKNSTTPALLGQVFVFMNVSEFSPIVSTKLLELSKVPGIAPVYYMDERRPQEYMSMLGKSFFEVADKITFKVDGSGKFAEAYGVTAGNTVVLRLPNGSIRRYKLVSELPVLIEQLNRLRQGQST